MLILTIVFCSVSIITVLDSLLKDETRKLKHTIDLLVGRNEQVINDNLMQRIQHLCHVSVTYPLLPSHRDSTVARQVARLADHPGACP